ncbi:acyl-CoA thioesterase domain-containing protein [Gordonia humi]|uniref:Acyl-coenzyme A thioesterase PaaI-like protein n=1 Tax=Gordonia humi TaxID=686429 RepID=A0A840EZG4_9ACTN|nr:acyl-coenzyme A thioesterase PaaI-like protein [Gordonia humi]
MEERRYDARTEIRLGTERVDGSTPHVMRTRMIGFDDDLCVGPCLGLLAATVDAAGGAINHDLRVDGSWTVTTEVSLDLVRHRVRPGDVVDVTPTLIGYDDTGALARTDLVVDGSLVGMGTVRSFFVRGALPELVYLDVHARPAATTIGDMLAIGRPTRPDQVGVLIPERDELLINDSGATNGGVVAACLEVAAHCALRDAGRPELSTGSIRISFLRPFATEPGAHYTASIIRAGQSTATIDAAAVLASDQVAATARVTVYS